MSRRDLLAGIVRGAASLALSGAALPLLPAAARAAGGFAVQLTQVLATEENAKGPKSFDPALKDLAPQLEKYAYRVWKRVGIEKALLGEGEPQSFALARDAGFTLYVRPRSAKEAIQLDLRIRDKDGQEILISEVKVKDGGTAIVAKELADRSGRLFLAVTVKRA